MEKRKMKTGKKGGDRGGLEEGRGDKEKQDKGKEVEN